MMLLAVFAGSLNAIKRSLMSPCARMPSTMVARNRSAMALPSVRGDFLSKLGRFEEARVEFERAASLTRNARERDLLLDRAAASARAELQTKEQQ